MKTVRACFTEPVGREVRFPDAIVNTATVAADEVDSGEAHVASDTATVELI